MESISEFYKGLDMDTAPHKVPPGFMRDASNIRLINNQGQGLIVVNINGNEYRFSLKNNYSPLGYCVYNSIAYIFSTDGTNGEIGCYPAPDGLGSFPLDGNGNPTYKALQNWTGNSAYPIGTRQDFNTPVLNFDKQHQIQCFARIDYDNSVNIYFTDNKNPFRCVNSGFDQTGTYISTERLYWTGNFNQINVFAESASPPIITGMTLGSGGVLQCGNYFFFLRYSTSSLNKTSFLGQSWAVQVSLSATNDMSVDGAPGGTVSTNQATLSITNIDTTYAFIEVAVVYYNSGTSSVYLIDNEYTITGSSMVITINGNEDQIAFTMAQIQQGPPPYNTCKTLAQLEDRAWIANLKQSNSLTPDMIAFANLIIIGYDTSLQIPDEPFNQSETFSDSGQYKDYENTYENVGYFRGETYPFGIVFVFTDGTESEAIPCNGFDDWNPGSHPYQSNPKGIYRFPANQYAPFATDVNHTTGSNLLNIMGVTFDWTTLPIPSGVVGWYFVRGERKQNLIYQGIVVPTTQAIPKNSTTASNPWSIIVYSSFPNPGSPIPNESYSGTRNLYAPGTYYIPVFDCYIPFSYYVDPTIGSSGTYNRIGLFPQIGNVFRLGIDHAGFYSPDHFFIQSLTDQTYTVHNIGVIHTTPMNILGATGLSAQSGYNAANFMFETLWIDFLPYTSTPVQCDNIPGYTPGGNHDNFTSRFEDGTSDGGNDPNCFFYYKSITTFGGNNEVLSNRTFQTCTYIGMLPPAGVFGFSASSGQNIADQWYNLANIYSDDPNPSTYNITILYNPANVIYEKISEFVAYNQATTKELCYNGDCFLQRTYMKQLYTPDHVDDDSGCADTLGGGVSCAAGVIFSVITENNINTAMRIQDLQNLYYPKTGLNSGLGARTFYAMASANNDAESDITNEGYDQTLSGFTYEGFDINLPFQETQFPTRIAFSNFHPNGSFTDYYRIFDLAAYQDYDYRLGEINWIGAFHSRLVSVQDSGINFHLVNERALLNSSSAGDILIGSGTVLDAKAQVLSDVYGSQHQWSIVQTDYNFYGIDFNKRKIWRVKPDGAFENISDTKNVTAWINSVFLPLDNPESTIVNVLADNPISSGGIVGGYDRKYGDVVFTVVEYLPSGGNNTGDIVLYSDSMCFSEKMDEFTNRPQYNSPFYLSLNNDFFSINPIADSALPLTSPQQNFYVHDVAVTIGGANNVQTFYSVLQKSFITYIHNENSDYEKIYSNLKISSNGNEFSNIIFDTEEQTSNNLTFRQPNALWIDPRFRENLWWVSVPRATFIKTTSNNPDLVLSVMRGKYLQVYIEYRQATQQYWKSVKMYFRISY